MKMKKYKTVFFLILFVNILTTIVINSTVRKSEIFNEAITKGISLTHNQMTVVAMVSSIFTVFLLSVFLILARLLLILIFKIVFKKKGDKKLINEIYFISVGSKLIFSTVAIVSLFSATSWTFIFTSSCAIILYIIYLFANKQNTISGRTKKENIFQLITGCLLILLI